MALLSLDLRDPLASALHGTPWIGSPLRLSFPNVNRRLFPRRGLVFSLLVHGLAVCTFLLVPMYFGVSTASRTRALETEDFNTTTQTIYLPRLGGGSEGSGRPGGGPIIPRRGSPTTAAPSTLGLSSPGPQAILSDPPRPTNTFQTIMRPALKHPPVLNALIRVPNIVEKKNAGPLAAPELKLQVPKRRVTKASEPDPVIVADQPPTTEMPKLTVPEDAPQRPALPSMQAPKVQSEKANASTAPQFSPVPTTGSDEQNLLAISLVPAPPGSPTDVPDGEARGRFAISPDANPGATDAQPGSRLQGATSGPPAIGNESQAAPGNAVGEGHVGMSGGPAGIEIGGSGGTGTATGNGIGSGNGGNGGGNGRGSATGEGMGSGPGGNAGAGSGAGAGPGSGDFRGVSIGTGTGNLDPSFVRSMVYPVPVDVLSKLRRNTIIISAGSIGGGGLDVYGALNCAKIYTIFLPMPGGNWTMQYCVGAKAADAGLQADSTSSTVVHLPPGLAPPDPYADSQFDFKRLPVPPEKASKMIVLKGVLRADGTVDALEVYRGVLPEMDEAARIAFSRWKFKPAMQEDKAVSLQILVGIPVEVRSTRHEQ